MRRAAGRSADDPGDQTPGAGDGQAVPFAADLNRVDPQSGYADHRFGPPSKRGLSRGLKAVLVVLVVVAIVGAGSLVALVAAGRKAPKGFGEAFTGQPCRFLTDQEVEGEFGSAVARDLDSVAGRGFERAQDTRIVLEGPDTCVVTFEGGPVTFSGSPSAIVNMTEGGDASEVFDRTRQNAQNRGFLAEGTVDVGEASFCTSPDTGGVGGVLARTGNRITYVIYDGADTSTTSTSAVDDALSCREAARVARLVLD